MGILDTQLDQLRQRYAIVDAKALGSGTTLVTIPGVPLPAGWNKPASTIRFLVPAGYPFAALDCFWADEDLRLASGQLPTNSGCPNPIPESGQSGLWFSWHLTTPWNPNRDTLSSWVNSINDRMRQVR
jgi:hypothetical protein